MFKLKNYGVITNLKRELGFEPIDIEKTKNMGKLLGAENEPEFLQLLSRGINLEEQHKEMMKKYRIYFKCLLFASIILILVSIWVFLVLVILRLI